ncbi:L,D-transpeptidase family protein [Streptomyces sp. NPDC003691]
MTGRTLVLVRRTAAAAAVLALAAGCSARAADGPAGEPGAVPAPGSATSVPSPPSPPSQSPSSPPDDGRSGDGTPARSAAPAERPAPAATGQRQSAAARETGGPVLMRRGDQGERVRELQARLAQIGWYGGAPTGFYGKVTATAVRGFQGKRGLLPSGSVTGATWDRLLGMTARPTRDELAGRTTAARGPSLDPRCLDGRVLCISKKTRTLSWVVNGTVRATMDVRFGSQYTPTREGVFSVFLKSRDHVSTLYDTPMPYALFFSGGQAVHYSADFAARGYRGTSHGCVNVRDRAAVAALFDGVRIGDRVVVHR